MPLSSTNVVAWADGYDLAGSGALTEMLPSETGEFEASAYIGPPGRMAHEIPIGLRSFGMEQSGYLDSADVSLRRVFGDQSALRTLSFGVEGASVGSPIQVATRMFVGEKSITPEVRGISKMRVRWVQGANGELIDGKILAGGQRVGNTNPTQPSAVTDSRIYDQESRKALDYVLAVEDIEWDGATQLTVQVRGSNNGTSNWIVHSNPLVITPSATGGFVFEANTSATRRYLYLDYQWGGTPGSDTSAKIFAAVAER